MWGAVRDDEGPVEPHDLAANVFRAAEGAMKQNGPSHDDAGGAVRDASIALLGESSQARKPDQ